MIRFAHVIVLAAFLAVGLGTSISFAGEPTPAEQKEKKDANTGKADDESKNKENKKPGQPGQ